MMLAYIPEKKYITSSGQREKQKVFKQSFEDNESTVLSTTNNSFDY